MSQPSSDALITVFGAYGHTAQFVTAELCRRGWTPILSGRDAAKLAAIAGGTEVRVASIDDPASLDRALAGAVAVINCAGPFAETAPAVIEAALRARIHYLDVTGEAVVAVTSFADYTGDTPGADRVRRAGVVVAPAVGFYGALGDLLATAAMADWPSADEISIATALDSWKPTRGTRLAGERRAGRRVVFEDHQLVVRSGAEPPPTGTWQFPAPIGTQDVLGEFSTVDIVTISRHLATPKISACINLAPIRDLGNPGVSGPVAADASGRSSQTFLVEAVVRRGSERRRAIARGRDIYAITAPILVEALARILDGRRKMIGTVAVGEAFDARDFLTALAPELSIAFDP